MNTKQKLRFIDLFSGIGGTRIGIATNKGVRSITIKEALGFGREHSDPPFYKTNFIKDYLK